MENQPIDTVYLLGWEYNRLLDAHPGKSARPSGLPASALWNRGSFFWLFKRVMCPKAAFDGDVAARRELGWTSGQIFSDLKDFGAVELFDLNNDLTEPEQQALQASSFALSPHFTSDRLRAAIEHDEAALENIKKAMYGPLLGMRGWRAIPAPKSVSHWFEDASSPRGPHDVIQDLAELLEEGAASPILPSPRALVTERERAEQKAEEDKTQKPIIASLLLGDLSPLDYMKEVAKGDLSKYAPLDSAMGAAWETRKDLIRKLRDLASADLWPLLHNDWLPQIASDPTNLKKIAGHIKIAIRRVEEKANAGALPVGREATFACGILLVNIATATVMQKLEVDQTTINRTLAAMTTALLTGKRVLTTPVPEVLLSERERRNVQTLTEFFQAARAGRKE